MKVTKSCRFYFGSYWAHLRPWVSYLVLSRVDLYVGKTIAHYWLSMMHCNSTTLQNKEFVKIIALAFINAEYSIYRISRFAPPWFVRAYVLSLNALNTIAICPIVQFEVKVLSAITLFAFVPYVSVIRSTTSILALPPKRPSVIMPLCLCRCVVCSPAQSIPAVESMSS